MSVSTTAASGTPPPTPTFHCPHRSAFSRPFGVSRTLCGLGGSLQWAERFRPPRRPSPVRLCQEVSDSVLVFQKPAAGAPPSPMAPRVPPTHPAPTSQLPLDAAGGSRSPDLAISRSHWGTQFCASCVREVQTSRFHGNVVWEQGNQWMLFSQINLVSLLRLQAPLSSLVFSHSASSAASPICLLPPGTCARGASPAGMWGAPRGAGLRLRPLVGHIESMA